MSQHKKEKDRSVSARMRQQDPTQRIIEAVDVHGVVVDQGVMVGSSNTGMAIMKQGGVSEVQHHPDRDGLILVMGGRLIPLQEVEDGKASA